MKYEKLLQQKELISTLSGESYYSLFTEVANGRRVDLSSPYSLIDSLRSSIENFGKQNNEHACIEKVKKIINSKAMKKTKLYELNQNLLMLQFSNSTTPASVAKNITNTLSPAELEHHFYKFAALAQLYYAYKHGQSQILTANQPKKEESTFINRNTLYIRVTENIDSVYLNGRAAAISQLRDSIIEYFIPKQGNHFSPEIETVEIELIGKLERVKLSVILQSKLGTPFLTYINVQNIITDVYQQLRDELSFIHFGLTFEQLSDESKQKAIIQAIPKNYIEQPPTE